LPFPKNVPILAGIQKRTKKQSDYLKSPSCHKTNLSVGAAFQPRHLISRLESRSHMGITCTFWITRKNNYKKLMKILE